VLRRRRMIRSYDEARPVPSQAIDAVRRHYALRRPVHPGVSLLVLTGATDCEAFWQLTAEADGAWLRGIAGCAGPDLGLDQRGGPTLIGTPSQTKAG
jgi:hypothetical protein